MRTSSYAILTGAILFVLPIPGTFLSGAAILIGGGIARWFGW